MALFRHYSKVDLLRCTVFEYPEQRNGSVFLTLVIRSIVLKYQLD